MKILWNTAEHVTLFLFREGNDQSGEEGDHEDQQVFQDEYQLAKCVTWKKSIEVSEMGVTTIYIESYSVNICI